MVMGINVQPCWEKFCILLRNGYSGDPADLFLDDLKRLLERLEKQPVPAHDGSYASISH